MPASNNERPRTSRIGWLRAAVLGANDGILSTSSLVLGTRARPIQAALASAGSFAVWAVMPLLVATIASPARVIPIVAGSSLLFLALLGGLAARAGGAGVIVGALRVTFWGALAMAATA